jgi:hypothetical protein
MQGLDEGREVEPAILGLIIEPHVENSQGGDLGQECPVVIALMAKVHRTKASKLCQLLQFSFLATEGLDGLDTIRLGQTIKGAFRAKIIRRKKTKLGPER